MEKRAGKSTKPSSQKTVSGSLFSETGGENDSEKNVEEFSEVHQKSSAPGYKILIAEDLEMNARLLTVLLDTLLPGSKIIVAEDGEKAWKAFLSYEPDIIFMDIQMPVMDGVETTRKIRGSNHAKSGIPIIAVSAGAKQEQKPRCMKAGMNAYITKPVLRPVLVEAIDKYLHSNT